MATTTSPSISPPILILSSILKPKRISSSNACNSHLSISSHLPLPSALCLKTQFSCHTPVCVVPLKATEKWRISAFPQNLLLLEADPVENSQLVESASTADGVSSIISVLLFVAFIGLSILTIGVIYIAVTDFLQKRERDKFEKEEAAKKKNGKKGKIRARARAGPRGFGQKIEEDDDAE